MRYLAVPDGDGEEGRVCWDGFAQDVVGELDEDAVDALHCGGLHDELGVSRY